MSSLDIPSEILLIIAKQARELRLAKNLTQEGLAKRSGVSLASSKRFERLGKISLESLLELALVLEALDEFKLLFKRLQKPQSVAELLKEPKLRKRGSIV